MLDSNLDKHLANGQIEVESELQKLSKIHKPGRWIPEDYIGAGNSKFVFLNLKVPHIRKRQKAGYTFADNPIEEQWKIWTYIWNQTPYFEAALSAAHFVNAQSIEELFKNRESLFQWQRRIDNWALSDELSNCYSRLLDYDRTIVLPKFKAWNMSKNPWEKRQSMVGLLYYSRFRSNIMPCSKILSFVEPHLGDSHYYVQKAVGWTLRECWNVYPQQTMKFLKKHATQIPSGGWTAATEKLSKNSKIELKKIRANG